ISPHKNERPLADAEGRAGEERFQVSEAALRLVDVAIAARRVVLDQVLGELVVPHAVGSRNDRRAAGDGPLAELEEAARALLLLMAGALAHGPAVDVVLAPQDGRLSRFGLAGSLLQLRSVEVAHHAPSRW